MKKIIGYAAIGIAGYLIGFYEMKYKVVKAIAENAIKKDLDDSNEEVTEEEA